MSQLTIKETFTLDASPERVWAHLLDPEKIVVCLPGAELTGREDDRTYTGAVRVKVGALSLSYKGRVVFEEIDEAERHVKIVGTGRERTGSGTATMTMYSRVESAEPRRGSPRAGAKHGGPKRRVASTSFVPET